jgi:hypothetical protein
MTEACSMYATRSSWSENLMYSLPCYVVRRSLITRFLFLFLIQASATAFQLDFSAVKIGSWPYLII